MLRAKWRKRGVSRLMHDELMSHRQEERVELLVRRERPRLRALYESWKYTHAGEKLPFPRRPAGARAGRGLAAVAVAVDARPARG
ncbi:acetyltransferase [Streptomyces sp. 4F14]|uniref:acetyltransferase n=1 Tax=Streptomyces sp. 4F14 TaxID=3394380 RepID=UPI003A8C73EB